MSGLLVYRGVDPPVFLVWLLGDYNVPDTFHSSNSTSKAMSFVKVTRNVLQWRHTHNSLSVQITRILFDSSVSHIVLAIISV